MGEQPYALGLDIGTSSVGWACVRLRNGQTVGILAAGVRQFDAGMSGTSNDFERGKELSNAIARRQARLARRQLRRRAHRRWQVFKLLQNAGLLPPDPVSERREISPYIERLDEQLRKAFLTPNDHISSQLLVYRIRARAVRGRVDAYALGRAMLHLAKRRGFNSNLRGAPDDDEEKGTVKPAIKSLAGELSASGSTLGEYLSHQNPFEKRIRQRWTGREMYRQEFERIWNQQACFHPELTDQLKRSLARAIFHQRAIKSAKGLVGTCSLEPKRRRLASAHPLAQEVRMLQFVNHLRVVELGNLERPLSDAERDRALTLLSNLDIGATLETISTNGKAGKKAMLSALKLPSKAKLKAFDDEDDKARGLGTVSTLRLILGKKWSSLLPCDQEQLFYEVLTYNKKDALIRRCVNHWRFTTVEAEALAELQLEPGYSRHSRVALEKLRDALTTKDEATGRYLSYAEAIAKVGYHARQETPVERLPPVVKSIPNLRNPAVIRALTEMRKVVNELLTRFGKPELIRIELARELKKSKKERKRYEDLIKQQTAERRKAFARIRQEFTNYPEKAGYDRGVEMVLLANECDWKCPYTGEAILSVRDLLGDNSRFDIEHIFPRRYLDNSFANKTLCLNEENRNVKKDRLPAIAYEANPARFQEILKRVSAFKGLGAAKKLARFKATEVPTGFVNRQLNETREASVAAADYLGLLYGGRSDVDGRQRIFTLTGGLTASLRGQWRLNQILSLTDSKNRNDHRQHAIDAIVAACTDSATVKKLQEAAAATWYPGKSERAPAISPPWPTLLDDCRKAISEILVSHRYNRRVNGPLHGDSNYTPQLVCEEITAGKIRKPLASLSETEILGDAIVDNRIRELVQARYEQLKEQFGASKKPKDLFGPLENHPVIPPSSSQKLVTPIHSVRVWVKAKAQPIRQGDPTRAVTSTGGCNYCARIVKYIDRNGIECWQDEALSRLDVLRNPSLLHPTDTEVFRLFPNEHVIKIDDSGNWQVYRVLSISDGDIELRLHYDGRIGGDVKGADRVRLRSGSLKSKCFRKVAVSPAGILRDGLNGEVIDLKTLAKPAPSKQTSRSRKKKES